MSRLIKAIISPRKAVKVILNEVLSRFAYLIKDDEKYLRMKWSLNMDYPLNLEHPTTFSEKLQWLKLHDHNPLYTTLVDKVAVKEYVSEILGPEFIIPTLGVWDNPKDIDWDSLPDQFVMKCTNDSNSVIICKDKSRIDKEAVVKKYQRALKHNYFYKGREWPYKNVPRRIIAEKYIEPRPDINDLPDYKFFCFNGEPKYCQVISGRGKKMCIDFFDKDWNHQPFHEPHNYPFAKNEPERPKYLNKMWLAATKLSKDKAFSRIDFYEVGENVYFGEVTFFPTGGLGGFAPQEYDKIFGQLISLPGQKGGGNNKMFK